MSDFILLGLHCFQQCGSEKLTPVAIYFHISVNSRWSTSRVVVRFILAGLVSPIETDPTVENWDSGSATVVGASSDLRNRCDCVF